MLKNKWKNLFKLAIQKVYLIKRTQGEKGIVESAPIELRNVRIEFKITYILGSTEVNKSGYVLYYIIDHSEGLPPEGFEVGDRISYKGALHTIRAVKEEFSNYSSHFQVYTW